MQGRISNGRVTGWGGAELFCLFLKAGQWVWSRFCGSWWPPAEGEPPERGPAVTVTSLEVFHGHREL